MCKQLELYAIYLFLHSLLYSCIPQVLTEFQLIEWTRYYASGWMFTGEYDWLGCFIVAVIVTYGRLYYTKWDRVIASNDWNLSLAMKTNSSKGKLWDVRMLLTVTRNLSPRFFFMHFLVLFWFFSFRNVH